MRVFLVIVFGILLGFLRAGVGFFKGDAKGSVTLSGVEGCVQSSRLPLEVTWLDSVITPKDSVKADTLVALAKSQLGKNYCYAVSDPDKGFDCSGFVYFVFNSFKIEVPRSSKFYKDFGKKIPIDSARVGDVIVFTGTNAKRRSPGHVGIVLSCENGVPTFIHSSSGKKKGVIISDFNESPYYKKRFIKIVRVAVVY